MITSGISEITKSITEICVSKRKEVDGAVKLLRFELSDPFKSASPDLANFIEGYKGLSYCARKVVGEDDVNEVLNVIFGCMYLMNCHNEPKNVDKVWDTWRICYNDSKINIDSGLKYIIDDCSRFRDYFVGNNILFGAGVSVISLCKLGPTLFGNMMNSINKTMNISFPLSQNLLSGLRMMSTIGKAVASVTVVLSIFILVNDSIEVHKIDETYKPFNDFYFDVNSKIDSMREVPNAMHEHIYSVQKYSLLCKRIEENAVDD
uniref:Uncharacterized protein n=1 Tax=viral metagenome TaxID=1070528 RepID=A0A6C0C963_9ZZZZ